MSVSTTDGSALASLASSTCGASSEPSVNQPIAATTTTAAAIPRIFGFWNSPEDSPSILSESCADSTGSGVTGAGASGAGASGAGATGSGASCAGSARAFFALDVNASVTSDIFLPTLTTIPVMVSVKLLSSSKASSRPSSSSESLRETFIGAGDLISCRALAAGFAGLAFVRCLTCRAGFFGFAGALDGAVLNALSAASM